MILVGVDGSAPSRVAVRWSVMRAAATREEIMLLHAVDDEWGVMGIRLLEELKNDAGRVLLAEKNYAQTIDSTVTLSTVMRPGNPMQELIAVSEDAVLVVVGTHKSGFVRGRVFGSRSLQLAGASHAPVAIIPESPTRTRRGIVVGVNGSPAADAAVRFAATEAHRTQQELIIVGAWASTVEERPASEAQRAGAAVMKARIEAVLADAVALAKQQNPSVSIRVRHVNRPPAEALNDASAAAEMLVLGSSRRAEASTTLGPVAHDVLINLSGPTIVVHAPEGDKP